MTMHEPIDVPYEIYEESIGWAILILVHIYTNATVLILATFMDKRIIRDNLNLLLLLSLAAYLVWENS